MWRRVKPSLIIAAVGYLLILLWTQLAWAATFSVRFDNIDQNYFTAADSASLSITGNLSLCSWIKLDNNATSSAYIVKAAPGTSLNGYGLWSTAAGHLSAWTADGSTLTQIGADSVVSTNVWHQICAVYNGTTMLIYLDGIVDNSTQADTRNPTDGTDVLEIGADSSGAARVRGYMTAPHVYARALSSGEVTTLLNCGEPSATSLAAWWKFDEGSGTTLTDSSGNGNTATFQSGAVEWTSDVPSCFVTPTDTPTETATPTPTPTVTPTPTCVPAGFSCSADGQCCSGVCAGNIICAAFTATPTQTPTTTNTGTVTPTRTHTPIPVVTNTPHFECLTPTHTPTATRTPELGCCNCPDTLLCGDATLLAACPTPCAWTANAACGESNQ